MEKKRKVTFHVSFPRKLFSPKKDEANNALTSLNLRIVLFFEGLDKVLWI